MLNIFKIVFFNILLKTIAKKSNYINIKYFIPKKGVWVELF